MAGVATDAATGGGGLSSALEMVGSLGASAGDVITEGVGALASGAGE